MAEPGIYHSTPLSEINPGKLDRPNAWNINRTAAVTNGPKGRTRLRVVAKSTSSQPVAAEVYLRKVE
jgi:hypothetical protein